MAPARRPALDEITPAHVEAAQAAVERAGAVAVKKLVSERLSRAAEAALVEGLVRRGLERTARVVRVPLEVQIRAALAASGELPLAGLQKRLAGASSAEARRTALALVRAGHAVLVKEGRRERLLPVDARTLDAGEVHALAAAASALKAQLKELDAKLRAARATKTRPALALLRDEIHTWQARARALLDASGARSVTVAPTEGNGLDSVLACARRLDRDGLGLVFVPELVGALAREADRATVHAWLERAAVSGAIELRPESGLDRLSDEERRACLTGPSGRLVSYVRLR